MNKGFLCTLPENVSQTKAHRSAQDDLWGFIASAGKPPLAAGKARRPSFGVCSLVSAHDHTRVSGGEAPAGEIAACSHVSAQTPPKVSAIFGQAFFKKLAGSGSARRSGVFFSLSLFFCACGIKRKGVEQIAQPPWLQANETLQRAGIHRVRPR